MLPDNQIAGLRVCHNFFLVGKEKLAKEALIDGSNIAAVSYALSPTLSQVPALS